MDTYSGSLQWTRRTPDWTVAAVAGLAAGAVLMVLDMIWSSLFAGGGPWQTSHMIAPIFVGSQVAQTHAYSFSAGVVAIALATHYVLGIVFGLILGTVMAHLNLDTTLRRAVSTGAVFGIALYVIDFYGIVRLFPWLAELRSLATLAAHMVFGVVAALVYWRYQRSPPVT